MNVTRSIEALSDITGPLVLAIGVFDGVHLGHRAVIERATTDAKAIGGTPVVVTFDPHPAAILRPQNAPPSLTSTRHKLKLLGEANVRDVLVIPFTQDFAAKSPETFIRELAIASRPLREICVGEDWAFGNGRAGNVALLSRLGAELGFAAVGIPAVTIDGQAVSSTSIRGALEGGELGFASRLLGRDFSVLGTVAEGRKLGRTLGYPTANIHPECEQLPPNGVYSVRVASGEKSHEGIANVGVRPTVSGAGMDRVLEVHLFDFNGNLYGRDLEVAFLRFVRPEQKFSGLDALRAQIERDVAEVRRG